MSMNTPGPWQTSGVRTRLDGQPMLQVIGPKGVVAYVPYSDLTAKDHLESHADAKLIAGALAASDLLRIIARGVEIGQSGNMRDLQRGDLMTLARNYCDANGLSYARADLRVVERAGFLRAGDSR